jgi:hypothetical protein
MTVPGGLRCTVTGQEFSFSFIQGDNEVVPCGGATGSDGEWLGSLAMRVVRADGTTEYVAKLRPPGSDRRGGEQRLVCRADGDVPARATG